MYEELVARLREEAEPCEKSGCVQTANEMRQAADAIEELSREVKSLNKILGTHPDPKGKPGEPGVPHKEETE